MQANYKNNKVYGYSDRQTPEWKKLWAKSKPRHPLWKHLLDTAAVSLALPPLALVKGWEAAHIAFLAGLHDIGKADSRFQFQIPQFVNELIAAGYPATADARCRHERISAKFIKKMLEDEGLSPNVADTISRAVVVHHGYWNETARDVGPEYATARKQLIEKLKSVLDIQGLPKSFSSDHSSFGMRLAGHIVLCDWIASNEKFFSDARLKDISESDYFENVRNVAADWVKNLGLMRNKQNGQPYNIVTTPRPIQQVLLNNDIPPGLVIIEAPTGEGKTEAAWILSEKWRDKGYHGIYMALPTMATSDSLHARYRDDYLNKLGRDESTKLVHGMAWLRDHTEPEKLSEVGEPGDDQSLAAAWFRPTRRAMLAAHGVGTVDQAMLAGMHVKFGYLRLYGLSDRILIIDEVHAYDAYMSAIICRLLQWCACLKIPVILLSATLSSRQRAAMLKAYGAQGDDPGPDARYPLITVAQTGKDITTHSDEVSSKRTLEIKTHQGLLGDAKKTAKMAAELVKDGGCCCVILNTVKQAQAVYHELVLEEERGEKKSKEAKCKKNPAALTKEKVMLFHARFTPVNREHITNQVLDKFGKGRWLGEGNDRKFKPADRPERFVLVATQVVEQSLDVDFDHMISEIAPIDLLLQRSGRIKRHARTKDGKLKASEQDERGHPILHILLPEIEMKQKDGLMKKIDHPNFGLSEKIYERYPLLQALREMSKASQIKLPDNLRPLIKATYDDVLSKDASADLQDAESQWKNLQEDLAAQAGEFLLCEPMDGEFDPAGADEVGDDSDDGNGWRAQTRLGIEDILVIAVEVKNQEELNKLAEGDCARDIVKELYQQSVKIPPYYWPPKPAKKYGLPVLCKGRLRGAWLLPVTKANDGWEWRGIKKDGKNYSIEYDPVIGLIHGGDK